MKVKTILLIVIAVLVCVIILQNTNVVVFKFFFWELAISRILLIPIFILIGMVIGYMLAMKPPKKKAGDL